MRNPKSSRSPPFPFPTNPLQQDTWPTSPQSDGRLRHRESRIEGIHPSAIDGQGDRIVGAAESHEYRSATDCHYASASRMEARSCRQCEQLHIPTQFDHDPEIG